MKKRNGRNSITPTEVIKDLIGARVVCWFVDDCLGVLEFIKSSNYLNLSDVIEDYISNPKDSGYRSIHVSAEIGYDAVRSTGEGASVQNANMTCEIQIRSKLQDAWGDLTHEFHYKADGAGVKNKVYESMLSDVARRLASEDQSLMTLRNAYQDLAEEKLLNNTREGFRGS